MSFLRWEYLIILPYLIIFFVTTFHIQLLINFFVNKKQEVIRIYVGEGLRSLLIFMKWKMFHEVSNYGRDIKIIVKTKDDIEIYYLSDLKLKKIIKELDLQISCYASLSFSFNKYYNFLRPFIIDKLKIIHKNIKHISFYTVYYKYDTKTNKKIIINQKQNYVYYK